MTTILTSLNMKVLNVVTERGAQIGTGAIACAGSWKILFAARVRGVARSTEYITCWVPNDKALPSSSG